MKDPIPKGKVNNGRWEVGKDDEKNTRISCYLMNVSKDRMVLLLASGIW